jgi:hypothetical protein
MSILNTTSTTINPPTTTASTSLNTVHLNRAPLGSLTNKYPNKNINGNHKNMKNTEFQNDTDDDAVASLDEKSRLIEDLNTMTSTNKRSNSKTLFEKNGHNLLSSIKNKLNTNGNSNNKHDSIDKSKKAQTNEKNSHFTERSSILTPILVVPTSHSANSLSSSSSPNSSSLLTSSSSSSAISNNETSFIQNSTSTTISKTLLTSIISNESLSIKNNNTINTLTTTTTNDSINNSDQENLLMSNNQIKRKSKKKLAKILSYLFKLVILIKF